MKSLLSVTTAALLCSVSAFAADLPARKSPTAVPVAAVSTWTGAYIGLNAGYAFSSTNHVTNLAGANPANYNGTNGFIAGGQLGFDYQINSIVLGLAADWDYSWASKNFRESATANTKLTTDYVATVRGRLGYAASDKLLAYATGGWAFSKGGSAYTDSAAPNTNMSETKVSNGYVLGLGAEYRYTANISSFAEYRYYNYSKTTFSSMRTIADTANSEIRAGVNYRF